MQDDNELTRRWLKTIDVLTTTRFVLRRLSMVDLHDFYAAMDNPRVNKWMGSFEQPFTLDAAKRWLAARLQRQADGEALYAGITFKDQPGMIGWFGIRATPEYDMPELAWALAEQAWGKYVIDEIGVFIVQQLEQVGVRRICATAAQDNSSSARLMTVMGMKKAGECMFTRPDGTERPSFMFVRES